MKKLVSLLVVAAFLFVAGDAMAKRHHKKHKKHGKPVATQPAAPAKGEGASAPATTPAN